MDNEISKLVSGFERGALSRRELVQGLSMMVAAAAGAAQAQAQTTGLKGVRIDHMSIQVKDLARSIKFYQDLFGFKNVSEDKPNKIVRLGITKTIVSLHEKQPTGLVDHFAIGVENFNKDEATRVLKAYGLSPIDDIDAGFHVKDPEGINVQIV